MCLLWYFVIQLTSYPCQAFSRDFFGPLILIYGIMGIIMEKTNGYVLTLIMKKKPSIPIEEASFGRRLARIRKAHGLTQGDLAKHCGISQRMIAYYEAQSRHIPPSSLLPTMAKFLKVSADELLGLKKIKIKDLDISMKLQSKLNIIPKLPRKQRKAVLDYAQALYRDQAHNKNGSN